MTHSACYGPFALLQFKGGELSEYQSSEPVMKIGRCGGGSTVVLPRPVKPVPLVIPEPWWIVEQEKLWEEARRLWLKILAETGAPPGWETLMRNPGFRKIVDEIEHRARRRAEMELAERWWRERAVYLRVMEYLRHERLRRALRMWFLTPEGRLAQSMSAQQERQAIGAPSNPNTAEGWMYHVTSFSNLPGIIENGLDPALGGSDRGSSELAKDYPPEKLPRGVNSPEELRDLSKKHSQQVVAASNNRLLTATYINQREDMAESQVGQPIGNFSVLLRFRNRREYFGRWEKDPMDARARLLRSTPIPVMDIECLTSEGWVPLARLDLSFLARLLR